MKLLTKLFLKTILVSEKEKEKKQQKRLDKVNHYRAIAGQKPLNPSQLNKKSKK